MTEKPLALPFRTVELATETESFRLYGWNLYEKYKAKFDVSSEGPSSGSMAFFKKLHLLG